MPMPEISVQVGVFVIVLADRGSLDHEEGILMSILPLEGMVFVGVRVKVKGDCVLTRDELEDIPQAISLPMYI